MNKHEAPQIVVKEGTLDGTTTYAHDAYGVLTLSTCRQGGRTALFGSDLMHDRVVAITLRRATLNRHLSNDWIHGDSGAPIAEVVMSHAQFAEFVMSAGRGDGTPCTISIAPPRNAPPSVAMPYIKPLQTKADLLRGEIKESAATRLAEIMEEVDRLGALIDSGKVGKTDLRAIHRSLKITAQNLPSNIAFVVEQAEEALEKSVSDARIEIEAAVNMAQNRLGAAETATHKLEDRTCRAPL